MLLPAVAAAAEDTAGAAIVARCEFVETLGIAGRLAAVLGALKLPSLAAACGLVTDCRRTADAAAAISVACVEDGAAAVCSAAADVAGAAVLVSLRRAT